MLRRLLAVLCFALGAFGARAEPLLSVEGVVSPAWLERSDGSREPIGVGDAVDTGAHIATGPGARVLLRMGEGSALKLGAQAAFAVDQLERETRGESSLWRGALDVLRGAFRYTTTAVAAARAERELNVRVGSLVAGIRGTDVWGKAGPDQDYIVLIEGRVTVARAGRDVQLDQPRSMIVAPRDGSAPPVARLSSERLAGLSAQTEILAGSGGAWRGGRYRVVIVTTVDETYARDLHSRLRAAGYPAELRTLEEEGSPLYQVHLTQLGGEREARAVAQRLQALGYSDARSAR